MHRRLVANVCNLGARQPRDILRQTLGVNSGVAISLRKVNLQNLGARLDVWKGHSNLAVKAARTQERRVECYIYETGTKNGKRVQALGGAKNHMLVLPDADLDMAADALVSAAYGSAGERCMAISVVLAVDTIADDLVSKVQSRIPNVVVGNGSDPSSEMGPLITGEHRDKVASYVAGAAGEGAKVVVDGREGAPVDGFFLKPSLIDHAKPGMKCYDDEIFGPEE